MAELIIPDLAGSFGKGVQLRNALIQRQYEEDEKAWVDEQKDRQRKQWKTDDNALLKAKQEQMQSDAAKIYSRLNPDDPRFDQEFDLAADWFAQRNPEGGEMITKIKALPSDQRKAYIKQARLHINLEKPNDYTLKPGEKRFDQFGGEIADGGPSLYKLGPGQEMRSHDGKTVIKGPPPVNKQEKESDISLWLKEQKKYKPGSRQWNFYERKLKGERAGGSGGDGAVYDPKVINYYADQLRKTGKLSITGYGKDTSELKRQIYIAAANQDIKEGRTGDESAYDAGDRKAIQGSIGMQEKQYGSMTSFVVNLDEQVKQVQKIAKDINTVDTRLLNLPVRAFKQRVAGNPVLSKYGLYLGEIQSEIGKLSSGSTASVAELSVGAREKWEHVLDENLSVKDMIQILEEVKHAGNMRLRSVETGLEKSRGRLRGVGGGKTSRPASSPGKKPATRANTSANLKSKTAKMSDDELFKIVNGGR